MPEMHFHIRWADGSRETCYSPSLVIKDHFAVGQDYTVEEFVALSRLALGIASERVRARYGLPHMRPHDAVNDALACAQLWLAQQATRGAWAR